MSNRYLRYISLLALLSISGISITQFIWFRKAYTMKEVAFSQDVHLALREVAVAMLEFNQNFAPVSNPVYQEANNYFVVRIDDEINADLLEDLLIKEFQKRNIKTDFEYGVYDCSSNKIRYGNYVAQSVGIIPRNKSEFPNIYYENNYFGVRFPQKNAALIAEMGTVLISTGISFLVILFFVLALYLIFKQKRLSEIQKDFVNNMTHEFKTPIATIAISAEVLKKTDMQEQPVRLQNYATIIYNEAMRLQNQVERILQSSNEEKSKIKLAIENINLQKFFAELLLHPNWQHDQQQINLEIPTETLWLRMDVLHLNNILHNLMDNAKKYGSENLEVSIKVESKNQQVLITFSDNGVGIPEDSKKRIFEKFYRVPTGNLHNQKCFGLGLYYIRQVMLAQGGDAKCIDSKGCCIQLNFKA